MRNSSGCFSFFSSQSAKMARRLRHKHFYFYNTALDVIKLKFNGWEVLSQKKTKMLSFPQGQWDTSRFTLTRTTRGQRIEYKNLLVSVFSFYNRRHRVPQPELPGAKAARVHLGIIEPGKDFNCGAEIAGQTLDFKRIFRQGFIWPRAYSLWRETVFAVNQKRQIPRGGAEIL